MAKRGKKKTSKKTAKRGRKTTAKRAPRSAGAALESMTVSELQAELNRRRRGVARLERRREKLSAELAAVNAEIAELGGSLTGGTGTRARNSMTLPDALHQVLQGVTMSVTEAAVYWPRETFLNRLSFSSAWLTMVRKLAADEL
jgi:septal ring factor EnvC (AmiA/AmiB activator)